MWRRWLRWRNAFHAVRPDQPDDEELCRAFWDCILLGVKTSWSQFNQIVCGLRVFMARRWDGRRWWRRAALWQKRPKVLPVVLLEHGGSGAALGGGKSLVGGGCCRRRRMVAVCRSELLGLQVTDIDASRMVLTGATRQGERRIVRCRCRRGLMAGVAAVVVDARIRHPRWLFPGRTLAAAPMSERDGAAAGSLERVVDERGNLAQKATLHTAPGTATARQALLEAGVDVVTLLEEIVGPGQLDLSTTAGYLSLEHCGNWMQKLPKRAGLAGVCRRRSKKAEGQG